MSSVTKDLPAAKRAGSKRTKRYHHKVRSGCQSCRDRHTKCDEAKPVCGRCHRLHLTCIFDRIESSKQSPSDSGKQALVRPRDGTLQTGRKQANFLFYGASLNVLRAKPDEQRHFDYYMSSSISRFSSSPNQIYPDNIGQVYLVLVPQVAQTSQAVRHAISAAASVEENHMRHSNTSKWLRERQYRHFHATIQAILRADLLIEELLVCCVLMFSYSCHNRDYEAANLHLRSGLRLIEERKRTSNLPILSAIEAALTDLEPTLALVFSESQCSKLLNSKSQATTTIQPFESEQEAHLALRAIISSLAKNRDENLETEYSAWQHRIEASKLDIEGLHGKVMMHLFNALLFVFTLIAAEKDSVVANTCQFAIEDQLQYVLSQNQACIRNDVSILQGIVQQEMEEKAKQSPDSKERVVLVPVTKAHVGTYVDSEDLD